MALSTDQWIDVGKTAVVTGTGLLDNLFNRGYQRRLQEKVWEREDTAMQRRVADLEKAGLSPALALGGQGASSGAIVSQTPSMLSASVKQGIDTYEQSVNGRSLRELQKAQEDLIKKQEEQATEKHNKEIELIDAQINSLGTNANANLINAFANSTNAKTGHAQYLIKKEDNDREKKERSMFGVTVSELPANARAVLSSPGNMVLLEKAFNKLTKSGGHASLEDSEYKVYREFVEALAENILEASLRNDQTELNMVLSKVDRILNAVSTATKLFSAIDTSLQKRSNNRLSLGRLLKFVK